MPVLISRGFSPNGRPQRVLLSPQVRFSGTGRSSGYRQHTYVPIDGVVGARCGAVTSTGRDLDYSVAHIVVATHHGGDAVLRAHALLRSVRWGAVLIRARDLDHTVARWPRNRGETQFVRGRFLV